MSGYILVAFAAIPVLCWGGYHAARWLDRRADRDRAERYRHQRLLDALTDPPSGRWR